MEFDYRMVGAEDLEQVLRELPDALRAQAWGDGFAAAARGIARRARRTVRGRHHNPRPPVLRGVLRPRLADSIRVKRVTWRWGGVPVRRSAAVVIAANPIALWIERGTAPRYTRAGRYLGSLPARPFLGPAAEQSGQVEQDFRRGAVRSVNRALKRLARPAPRS